MKRFEILLTFLILPVDILMILAGFILAYILRVNLDEVSPANIWPFAQYLKFVFALLPFVVLTLALEGLYSPRQPQGELRELGRILISASAGIMFVMLWVFISRNFFFSRLVLIYAWLFTILFLYLGRKAIKTLKILVLKKGRGGRRTALIGTNQETLALFRAFKEKPELGFLPLGIVKRGKKFLKGLPELGQLGALKEIIKEFSLEEIILTDTKISSKKILEILEACREKEVTLKLIPNPLLAYAAHPEMSTIVGVPLVEFKETPLEGWGKILKRAFDIMLASFGLIILSPLLALITVFIKLTSPGPIIYKHKRVGRSRLFNLYKFRTLKLEYCTGPEYGGKRAEEFEKKLLKTRAERRGPVPKIFDDPRVTPLGKFLRRTSLDELPQFWNVLKGEMSLVGPRPHLPQEVARYHREEKRLLAIKPGITGMAQISGRSSLEFTEEVQLDLYYIANWSIWLDCQILLKTIPVVLLRKGAY